MSRLRNRVVYCEDGCIKELCLAGQKIDFRQDEYGGIRFFTRVKGKEELVALKPALHEGKFTGEHQGLLFSLEYVLVKEGLEIKAVVRNEREVSYKPSVLGLRLGINNYMASYPEWRNQYFPTMMRCEKQCFMGYEMTPEGAVLAITSDEPLASWSLEYSKLEHEEEGDFNLLYLNGGHRIYTASLHLLNRPPYPKRLEGQEEIPPKGVLKRTIRLSAVSCLEQLPELFAAATKVPFIFVEQHTLGVSEHFKGRIYSESQIRQLVLEDTKEGSVSLINCENGSAACFETDGLVRPGRYFLRAENTEGKVGEASIFVKQSDRWYLDQARNEVLKAPPVYTHHMESFQSLYTLLLAEKHIPEPEKDKKGRVIFEEMMAQMYNPETRLAREAANERIQDSASMAWLMALYSEVTGNESWRYRASGLADFLMTRQREDGAYYCQRSEEKETHYTAVTYPAKYMMKVALAEKKIENGTEKSRIHWKSAEQAVWDLERRKDNIETEGEMTFEDGMISCSLLQMGFLALHMEDGERKFKLVRAAEELYNLHRCLTQQIVPDCRMNGATLRFWEAQYNVHMFHNGMNSPCGWTAWKVYGVWYLYLLTGNVHYYREAMNGLGTCLQLMDVESGELSWGFLCDPYIETERYVSDGAGKGKLIDDILGEQYLQMVTPWHRTEAFPRAKWGIDQMVHEVFGCMEEITLVNGYVIEAQPGVWECRNCRVSANEGGLQVEKTEKGIVNFHVNLLSEQIVTVEFPSRTIVRRMKFGWITEHGGDYFEKA